MLGHGVLLMVFVAAAALLFFLVDDVRLMGDSASRTDFLWGVEKKINSNKHHAREKEAMGNHESIIELVLDLKAQLREAKNEFASYKLETGAAIHRLQNRVNRQQTELVSLQSKFGLAKTSRYHNRTVARHLETEFMLPAALSTAGSSSDVARRLQTDANMTGGTIKINAGGGAHGDYLSDRYGIGDSVRKDLGNIKIFNTGPYPAAIYRSVRWCIRCGYRIPVAAGIGLYTVRLHFSESYWTSPGMRLFNVKIENYLVLSNLDVHVEAGGRRRPFVYEAMFVIWDDFVDIELVRIKDNALINAIEIDSPTGCTTRVSGSDYTFNGCNITVNQGINVTF